VTHFVQFLWDGVALGAIYALIALGFSVVYRASQVINFAQGSMLLVGVYLVVAFVRHPAVLGLSPAQAGLPFWLAVIAAIAIVAAGGVLFQSLVLRRMIGKPLLSVVMVTIGLSIVLTAIVDAAFGPNTQILGDPWTSSSFKIGGVIFLWVEVWSVGSAFVLLLAFFGFDRFSRYGLAMRSSAADPEAALAVGVPVLRVHAVAWAIAGAVAVVSGVFLSGFPSQPNPAVGDIALLAFPAVILGGLGSPVGAVVGGMTIGIIQELVQAYAPAWTGTGFYTAAPYIVMILVLLAKPYGLFGTKPVERL
jgi:branched-chain amino acid transport system permease protein